MSFWEGVLVQRVILLGNTIERLKRISGHDTDAALESVKASWERCVDLSSREFVTFVASWLEALEAWQARLASVPPAGSVEQALADLGLRHDVQPHERVTRGHGRLRPVTNWPVFPSRGRRRTLVSWIPAFRATAGASQLMGVVSGS
jgi:hypothetical protein